MISVVGISLEKRNLQLKRQISQQHDVIQKREDLRHRLYLKSQQMGAPPKLLHEFETTTLRKAAPTSVQEANRLLEWRMQSASPEDVE